MRTLALGLFFGVLSVTSVSAEVRSRVETKEQLHRFGIVSQGTKVTHDFFIENKGNAPLTIQRVVPGCGCTASVVVNPVVPPGGKERVTVTFDTTGFSGEKAKSVRVFTSDTDAPSITLTLEGMVKPPLDIEPNRVVFPELIVGQQTRPVQSVTITAPDVSTAQKLVVKSLSPNLIVSHSGGEGTVRRYDVSLVPGLPPGEMRERISVSISGTATSLNLPVFASVSGPLKITPASIGFGVMEGSTPLFRSVTFENFDPKKLVKVLDVQSDNSAIAATVKEVEPGKRFSVEIRVDPTKVSTNLRGTVTVLTDYEGYERVPVKVSGVLPPKL